MYNIGTGIKSAEAEANSFLAQLYDLCYASISRETASHLVNSMGTSHTDVTLGSPVHTFIRKQVNIINVKDYRADNASA